MKREQISDAIGLLDDEIIGYTDNIRRNAQKKPVRRRISRKRRYGMAAGVCVLCMAAMAVWPAARARILGRMTENGELAAEQTETEYAPAAEYCGLQGELSAGPDLQQTGTSGEFVPISSLLPEGGASGITDETLQIATLPIGEYMGIYTKQETAGSEILACSTGRQIEAAGTWYAVSGHTDLQYLICGDGSAYSLWKFQCFNREEYPYRDVLELVYGINTPDIITGIRSEPPKMDNTDAGVRIQKEIGTMLITDREKIEAVYEILRSMTCYGSDRWDLIDYGDVEAPSDTGTASHEAVRLGRYLSLVTDYGNEIDGLKYTAVSGMFYEFSGIAYNRLTEEQDRMMCEILEIE